MKRWLFPGDMQGLVCFEFYGRLIDCALFPVALAKEVIAVPDVAPNLDRYRKDRAFRYEDFAKREKNVNISPFRAQVCT